MNNGMNNNVEKIKTTNINNKKEKKVCPRCGKYLMQYIKSSDYCQKCYRQILNRYSFWKYKDENNKPSFDSSEYKICEILMWDMIKPKNLYEKYHEELGIVSVRSIYRVINKYLEKCDTLSESKPDIYK